MRISWLVRTVESKAYLREYNMVGVTWWTCSCYYCTWIYIDKLNILKKYSHFNDQIIENQTYMSSSNNTPSCLYCIPSSWSAGPRTNLPLLCFLHFLPTASANGQVFLPLLWPSRPQSPKFSWTRGAGRCTPLTPTHYFHPPHKDQSIRLQSSPCNRPRRPRGGVEV